MYGLLGEHDFSNCSVCKSLSTSARAKRIRAVKEALTLGYVSSEQGGRVRVFPPVPGKGGKHPSPLVGKEFALQQAEKAADILEAAILELQRLIRRS